MPGVEQPLFLRKANVTLDKEDGLLTKADGQEHETGRTLGFYPNSGGDCVLFHWLGSDLMLLSFNELTLVQRK